MGKLPVVSALLWGIALTACAPEESEVGDDAGVADAAADAAREEAGRDARSDGSQGDAGEDASGEDAGGEEASFDGSQGDAGEDASGEDAGEPPATGLIDADDFEFAGAFRVPSGAFGASNTNYAEGPFDITDGKLYMVGHNHHQAVAQFEVPELVKSETLADLNIAVEPAQPFVTLLGRVGDDTQSIDRIAGLKRIGDALLVNVYEYYDAPADNTHTTLVLRDADDLAGAAVDGYFSLQGRARAAGWISQVPEAFREALGGPMITGSSSGQPIISRLSVGPSAFVFDPADIVEKDSLLGEISTLRALDYSLDHPLHDDLLNESGANDLWTHLSRAVYGFIVPGTRTYATFGHSAGHGPMGVCYKCVPEGETAACGGYCARDPQDSGLRYWFFDVDDLLAVRAGELESHAVRPYAHGALDSPFAGRTMGGGAYDADTGRLFLSMDKADDGQGQYSNPPVFVAFRLKEGVGQP